MGGVGRQLRGGVERRVELLVEHTVSVGATICVRAHTMRHTHAHRASNNHRGLWWVDALFHTPTIPQGATLTLGSVGRRVEGWR